MKRGIIVILIILLTISVAYAGLLEEAKKTQEKRKSVLEDISANPIKDISIYTQPYKNKDTTEKPKLEDKGIIRPGDKIIIGDSELIATRLLTYEINEKRDITEIDLGVLKLFVPTESFRKEFRVSSSIKDRLERYGQTVPTGAPVKEIKSPITGAAVTALKERVKEPSLKDKFFYKTFGSPEEIGSTVPTGAPVADFKKPVKKFKVKNPEKKKRFFKRRGSTVPTGAPVANLKAPKFIQKIKELLSRD